LPILREPPRDVILIVLIKLEIFYEAPKVNKSGKVLEEEILLEGNFLHPCIVMQSLCHLPFFRLEEAKINGAMSIGLFPSSHGACQKGVFIPFPTVIIVAV
jgi:hypothetical protein